MPQRQRYITTWRKPTPDFLEFEHFFSESLSEAEAVVANIKKQGVRQFGTYKLGDLVLDLTSEY